MELFSGTGVAVVTPFDDGKILYSQTDKLLNYVELSGVNAIVALGTTGEAATLDEKDKYDFIKYVRERTSLPLIVGTGSNDTEVATKNCINAEKAGADGFLVVTPFYNKCTQNGAIAHYRYISQRVGKPIIVYNVPSRTGFNLLPETMAKIAKLKNVAGIKEASGNVMQIEKCLSLGINVYCGDDALTVPSVCMGAKGIISVVGNVAPKLTVDMVNLALGGKTASAAKLQLRLLPLIEALFSEVNPIPVRAALNLLGIDVGKPRLPITELSDENKIKLSKAMKDLGLI